MKNINKLTIYALASMLALASCKDDVEEIQDDQLETGIVEIPDSFSNYTTEQNKTNLEDNGISLVNEMEGLKSSTGIETSSQLANLLSRASVAPANGRMTHTVRTLANYGNGKASVRDVFASLRTKNEDPASIQEFYNHYTGVYTWNVQEENWDFSRESDHIIFKFPATENSTENNAEFIIHSYEGIMVANPMDQQYEGDLPTKIVMEAKVDGEKVIGYDFMAAYNQEGEPTNVTTSLQVNTFIFSINAQNEQEKVGVRYALKNGSKTLIAMGAGAEGMFTAEEIGKVNSGEHTNPGDVVHEVNAYFQLMNIKMAGNFDVKTFADGYAVIYADQYDENGYWNEEFDHDKAVEEEAALLDENFELVVFYADSKQKIADTEIYTYTDTYTYSTWEYDETSQDFVEKEVTEEYVASDIRLIFADGSKSDLETYFKEGFDDLISEVTTFIQELEN